MPIRIDEFSVPDGSINAGDRSSWLNVGFGFSGGGTTPLPSTIRFRIDEFARFPDGFQDAKDRTRYTSLGFDRATIVGGHHGGPGSGTIFPLKRKVFASKELPNLDYANPHLPVASLAKYVNEAIRKVVQGQDYGASWVGQQFILQNTYVLVPTDWVTVAQVSVTVVANVSLNAEISWQAAAETNVNWQFLRDDKILFQGAGHHLANALKTVTPVQTLYLVDEPKGDHTYALQLMTETEDVSVTSPTRLLVLT